MQSQHNDPKVTGNGIQRQAGATDSISNSRSRTYTDYGAADCRKWQFQKRTTYLLTNLKAKSDHRPHGLVWCRICTTSGRSVLRSMTLDCRCRCSFAMQNNLDYLWTSMEVNLWHQTGLRDVNFEIEIDFIPRHRNWESTSIIVSKSILTLLFIESKLLHETITAVHLAALVRRNFGGK